MAIIKGADGIEVTIAVDGKDQKEYVDENSQDEEKTVSKYIEAVSGKNFAVRCRVAKKAPLKGDAILFEVHADGRHMGGIYTNHADLKGQAAMEKLIEDVHVASNLYKKFVFSEIHTGESNTRLFGNNAAQLRKTGEVAVKAYHVIKLQEIAHKPFKGVEDLKVSEKDLKGSSISHSVGLGNDFTKSAPVYKKASKVDPSGKPFAVFKFSYRSLKALKDLLIIPRTPSPKPLADRPVESLTVEELRQLVKEQKEREEALRRVAKKEPREDLVKSEHIHDGEDNQSTPRKRARLEKRTEVIEIGEDGKWSSRTATQGNHRTQANREIIEILDD